MCILNFGLLLVSLLFENRSATSPDMLSRDWVRQALCKEKADEVSKIVSVIVTGSPLQTGSILTLIRNFK